MKNRYYSNTQRKQNNISYAQLILKQCIICNIILLAVLILNLVPSAKPFRIELKSQLSKNISAEKIKSVLIQNFNVLTEKIMATEDFQIDKKLIEQMKNEENEMQQLKKNSPDQI